MTRTTCGHCWGCGRRWSFRRNLRQRGEEAEVEVEAELEAEAEAEVTRGDKRRRDNQMVRTKWGGKDGGVRWHMTRGQDDGRGGHANKVEGSRMGNSRDNIYQQE
jgi:hypothetical protein